MLSQFKYGHYALNINYNWNILLLFLPRQIAIVWELAPRFDWQNMNVKLYCIRICVYVCTTPAAYSATIFTILVAPCLLFCYLAKVATTELNGAHIFFLIDYVIFKTFCAPLKCSQYTAFYNNWQCEHTYVIKLASEFRHSTYLHLCVCLLRLSSDLPDYLTTCTTCTSSTPAHPSRLQFPSCLQRYCQLCLSSLWFMFAFESP